LGASIFLKIISKLRSVFSGYLYKYLNFVQEVPVLGEGPIIGEFTEVPLFLLFQNRRWDLRKAEKGEKVSRNGKN
jgi:hypothetical protein